jgi:glycerophosphoryl diester phosphodiesterase
MRPSIDSDFFRPALPRIFAHRGTAGTHPENTMVSFQAASDLGALYLETDVHLSRDGEVVISHEPDLQVTCGHPGVIKDMNYADIAKADAGYTFSPNRKDFPFRDKGIRIPRLIELLTAFPKALFNIDLKPEDKSNITAAVVKLIDGARLRRRVLLASEFQNRLDEIRALVPEIPTTLGALETGGFLQALAARDLNYQAPGEALQLPPEYYSWKFASLETIAMAHRFGIEFHVWTINDEPAMREMLDVGVDGIFTDFPALGLKVAASRG